MARISPFQPYRYAPKAGALNTLVTQPYDKITPAMQQAYLAANPYNLVRIILGERFPSDSDAENVYTRAAAHLDAWIAGGVLERDPRPALYPYFQEFRNPDTGETLVRKGFIGLGAVEDYSAGVVHRHEQTLSGPKKDRMQLLEHTRAHFGQIFMLYPDPQGEIDRILDEAAAGEPLELATDEYATHRVWRIDDPERIARVQELMSAKKLLIADGHHRYETALAYRNAHPDLPGAAHVMMTFVNMYSPGLKILATHRLVSNLANFDEAAFLRDAGARFAVRPVDSLDALKAAWEAPETTIGAAIGPRLYALRYLGGAGQLDVRVLHEQLLDATLGIGEEAVRDEKYLRYIRGLDAAAAEAREGRAQIAFLLKPTSVAQTAEISFGGGVMPQKSTDFYPKLLSGLTIYKIDA